MKKDLFKGIALGCALTIGIGCGFSTYAKECAEAITVAYNNIRLVINNNEVTPRDIEGTYVEPFIYKGTTYVPARAIAEALGEKVDWDKETATVYIGDRNKTENVPMHEMKPYKGEGFKAESIYNTFQNRNETICSTNSLDGISTFILNCEYKEFNAMFAVEDRGSDLTHTVIIKNADTDEILGEYTLKKGEKPIEINVDVVGVDKLLIYKETNTKVYNGYLVPMNK